MNPENLPSTPEEFLEQITNSQKELSEIQARSWTEAQKIIEKVLDDADFAPESNARAAMFTILQAAWFQGYNNGTYDLSRYMMCGIGLGDVIDFTDSVQKLQQQINKTKPENN